MSTAGRFQCRPMRAVAATRDAIAQRQCAQRIVSAQSKAYAGTSLRVHRVRRPVSAPARRNVVAAALPAPSRLYQIAAAAAQPTTEALLMQNVLGSMCVGAILLVVTSLFTASGRKKWVDFFSSADNLLPQNPAIKRSLQWLPVIVVAKGLESVFGLPLLNWVYVAYSASMVQVMIGQAQQMAGPAREAVLAGVKEAEERKARGEQGGAAPAGAAAGADGAAAVNPFGGGFGINQTAAALFSRRFPELEGETYHATCPVMWREGGKDQQGQLYVTDRSVALHGTFGRGKQIVKLGEVAALAELSTGSDKMSAFTMTTADRGEVTITGVNSLGGNSLYPTVAQLWSNLRA